MDLKTHEDLEAIVEFYRDNAPTEIPQSVDNAIWKPTIPEMLWDEIVYFDAWHAIEKKPHEGRVLVAGSGDGRRAAYLNRLGYHVTGVELNPELVRRSRGLFSELEKRKLVDTSRLTVLEGDFLNDDMYQKSGLSFADFSKIFAYLIPGNFASLARKAESLSKPGTEVYCLWRPTDWAQPETSLELVTRKQMPQVFPYHEFVRYRKTNGR